MEIIYRKMYGQILRKDVLLIRREKQTKARGQIDTLYTLNSYNVYVSYISIKLQKENKATGIFFLPR